LPAWPPEPDSESSFSLLMVQKFKLQRADGSEFKLQLADAEAKPEG